MEHTIITAVGQKLQYDQTHSSYGNLFFQLFGRWPTHNFPKENVFRIIDLIDSIPQAYDVKGYFHLGNTSYDNSHLRLEILQNVEAGLQELRSEYNIEFLLYYGEEEMFDNKTAL